MAKFIVRDTVPCWVTWLYPIEADSEAEALQKYREGNHASAYNEAEIGDAIDGITTSQDSITATEIRD